MGMSKVDVLLKAHSELEVVRQQHDAAYDDFNATSAEDPSWNDKLLKLDKLSQQLREKTRESREVLAKAKGFSSYDDMVNAQPVTPRSW